MPPGPLINRATYQSLRGVAINRKKCFDSARAFYICTRYGRCCCCCTGPGWGGYYGDLLRRTMVTVVAVVLELWRLSLKTFFSRRSSSELNFPLYLLLNLNIASALLDGGLYAEQNPLCGLARDFNPPCRWEDKWDDLSHPHWLN